MSQSAQDVATLQSQACRIAASLDAARIPGGVDLHQRVMVAVVRMQTAEEQRMATEEALHTAGLSVDDGLHEAAFDIIRERDALKAELAEVKRDLHAELMGSDASHRLLDELGVEKDSGPDEMPPGAVLNVTERIRRLDAKHARRMTGAKQAVDVIRKLQAQAERERDALHSRVVRAAEACERLEKEHLATAKETHGGTRTAYRYAAGAAKVLAAEVWDILAPNSPELPDGLPDEPPCGNCGQDEETHPTFCNEDESKDVGPSDADFVTVRNTLAGSPGAASYNDAFNALLRLGLKAGKWDAALARSTLTARLRHILLRNGIDRMNVGDVAHWVLNGDDAKETP